MACSRGLRGGAACAEDGNPDCWQSQLESQPDVRPEKPLQTSAEPGVVCGVPCKARGEAQEQRGEGCPSVHP